MRCWRCGQRWYEKDEYGWLTCVICARPQAQREHEEPKADAVIKYRRYRDDDGVADTQPPSLTLGMEVK